MVDGKVQEASVVSSAKPSATPKVAQTPQTAPKVTRNIPRRSTTGVSIKAVLKGGASRAISSEEDKEEEVVEVGIDPSWNNPVSQERLIEEWNQFAFKVKSDNIRLYVMLYNSKPQLIDGTRIKVGLRNENQIAELNREKGNLFTHLKSKLRNANLTLETFLVQEKEGPQKAFTVSDKLKQMLEKNPNLSKLRTLFDLDLD